MKTKFLSKKEFKKTMDNIRELAEWLEDNPPFELKVKEKKCQKYK